MSADQLTLLAVDDERPVLEDLARLLRAAPGVGAVECAADGREALHLISRGSYDGIFLDVRMPELDGLELARVLRNFADPPQLVFVSAHDGAAVEAFELRALDYLAPVARARVLEAVSRVADAVAVAEPDGPTRPSVPGRPVTTMRWSRWPTCTGAGRACSRGRRSSTCRVTGTSSGSCPAPSASCSARPWPRSNAAGGRSARARAPPVRGQPARGDRTAATDRRHGRAELPGRAHGSRGPAPQCRARAPACGVTLRGATSAEARRPQPAPSLGGLLRVDL